ncbi:MAG: c-type cytochrome [Puia sp.]
MPIQKKLIYSLLFFMLPFSLVFAQMKQFIAPKTADAVNNPLKGDAAAAAEGKKIYVTYCTPCHGAKGRGDGVASAGLSKQPADHTSAAFQSQTDGAIFWKMSEGNTPMPAYKKILSQTQIWQLVDYVRTFSKSSRK